VGINIVAGMIVGVAQHGLGFGEAATTYTTLSIGDGLVSQIPGLLVSTGAALLATRGAEANDLGSSLIKQLLGRPRAAGAAAGVLATLALIPGMPHLAFLALAGGLAMMARRGRKPAAPEAAAVEKKPEGPAAQKAEIEQLLPVELLGIDVGLD